MEPELGGTQGRLLAVLRFRFGAHIDDAAGGARVINPRRIGDHAQALLKRFLNRLRGLAVRCSLEVPAPYRPRSLTQTRRREHPMPWV